MNPYSILHYPLATEKSVRLMEAENKLVFIVTPAATKPEIKQAVESLFKVKVMKVNTIHQGTQKKAYVKLSPDTPAIDIATQLGLM